MSAATGPPAGLSALPRGKFAGMPRVGARLYSIHAVLVPAAICTAPALAAFGSRAATEPRYALQWNRKRPDIQRLRTVSGSLEGFTSDVMGTGDERVGARLAAAPFRTAQDAPTGRVPPHGAARD
jgi:hypothetical protein